MLRRGFGMATRAPWTAAARRSSSDVVDSVRVGSATVALRGGGPLVPNGALARLPPRLATTLEWLCQKDALGQDCVLVASPAERQRARTAIFAFAELIRAEAFYVGVRAVTKRHVAFKMHVFVRSVERACP